jgi:hypothetical protein
MFERRHPTDAAAQFGGPGVPGSPAEACPGGSASVQIPAGGAGPVTALPITHGHVYRFKAVIPAVGDDPASSGERPTGLTAAGWTAPSAIVWRIVRARGEGGLRGDRAPHAQPVPGNGRVAA